MTQKSRVHSATSTHSMQSVKQQNPEFGVENNQSDMLLIDPEEKGQVSTHSADKPTAKGDKKAPVKAAIHDEGRPKGGRIAQIPNEVDPAAGYLQTESGMPVINSSSEEDNYDDMDDDEVEAEFEDMDDTDEVDSEFEDLADLESDDGSEMEAEFDDADMDDMSPLGEAMVEDVAEDDMNDAIESEADEVPMEFEAEPGEDEVPLLDVDAVDDSATDDVAFATVANVVHVLKSNRIIASMGPASARKVGMSDLYTSEQFQDVVEASLQKKGLRKGLVQAGFVLAKVKVTAASKATAKVVEAKVKSQINAKMEALARRDAALDQSMAIAAVGINRQFFKGTQNELKAALETQLNQMGVRGASRLIRAAFAEHGVSYAKSLVTLAQKISAMPEDVRNHYAEALDLTNDEDFDDADMEMDEMDDVEAEYEEDDMPESVTAALTPSVRRPVPALLKAGVKTTAAAAILTGDASLI